MARYRKIPVEIEAVEFEGVVQDTRVGLLQATFDDPAEWALNAEASGVITPHWPSGEPPYLMIKTLEGDMRANPGDWIIKGVEGEIYACKKTIFAATYEAA